MQVFTDVDKVGSQFLRSYYLDIYFFLQNMYNT